ncbi:MAG: FAD-dependent oxidoreductase [Myxococcales bacterium]|nr:FAD-dependent oxidoreductase [Myxococcales bacterium]
MSELVPAFGLSYRDLYEPHALAALDRTFRDRLAAADPSLSATFEAYRASKGASLHGPAESALLVSVSRHLEAFVAELFGVTDAVAALHRAADDEHAVMRLKRDLYRKRSSKLVGQVADLDAAHVELTRVLAVTARLEAIAEVPVAHAVTPLLDLEDRCAKALAKGGATVTDDELATVDGWRVALGWSAVEGEPLVQAKATLTQIVDAVARGLAALAQAAGPHARIWQKEGPQQAGWASFRAPQPVDHEHLVHLRRKEDVPEITSGPLDTRRPRDGFALTDRRGTRLDVANEVDYCILCHDREKDSCSAGLVDPKTKQIKQNPLGVALNGCPLGERIGEMHEVRREGRSLAALALVVIDNPACAGTGHRICNDCMKGCIYQKQDPVNIPLAETGALTDVLALPWGVEIYGLLTRWNPLNARRPHARPYNGKNVLVVGMGPAGYTLALHLLNEGFGVVGVDGLKIEPLPPRLVGRHHGADAAFPEPVHDWSSLAHELDVRRPVGFGGVAEYGITIRWDKNFNDLTAINLLRRNTFRLYGGVRFGGTLGLEDAFALGIDHVAIAAGAGKPTLIDIPNGLARGVRQASDFLMALQLTGAFRRDSLANLQVRLPAVVVGGGLTAIDTATELAAYYVVQCERTLARVERLEAEKGEEAFFVLDPEERGILQEQVAHGRAIREERARATEEGRAPSFQRLIDAWGGVTIAYRRTMKESPAYRLNHEEIIKALEEGVHFAEQLSPKEVLVDEHGAARAMVFERKDKSTLELAARTICIAAGTSPNVTYEREREGTFVMDPKTKAFLPHRVERRDGALVTVPDPEGFFTSYCDGTHVVSFYGDNLPRYAGSVVKAMASAKDGHPYVAELFADAGEADVSRFADLARTLDDELVARVHEVIRLTPTIVEVIVRAPRAARGFQPGQFYRLQNYEANAPIVDGTPLVTEGIALTGAWVDREQGLLSTIVLEMGGSTRLCATLKKGEEVVLMGPTGAPTHIPRGENVVLCGGGLGNAVLFSIGKALRAAGCKVVYFAGYRNPRDVYHEDDIEAAADVVVWSCDLAPSPVARRPGDATFVGNIVEAMVAYGERRVTSARPFELSEMNRIIAIGSDRMMAAVRASRHGEGKLSQLVRKEHKAIASINSPMQCMMKEICAQCLQQWVDPRTGKKTTVFTCFDQDQDMDQVDFAFLAARLRASSAQEKLTSLWVQHLMSRADLPRV